MPTLTIAAGGTATVTTVGGTDFKVISGRLNFDTSAISPTNIGFPMMAQDDFYVGASKTVHFASKYGAVVHYAELS